MSLPAASLFVLLIFLSCNENKEQPQPANNVRRDSTTRVGPERSVNPYASIDLSPMDMSYFPVEYPKLKMSKSINTSPLARIVYSRPQLQGRKLFETLLSYDEPWRLGANEATELTLYKDVTIDNKKIKAGRYTLYCIPHPGEWTIIFNSNIDTWGLEQDSTRDIARFKAPVDQSTRRVEYYTMVFEKIEGGANLLMAWDGIEVRLPIIF